MIDDNTIITLALADGTLRYATGWQRYHDGQWDGKDGWAYAERAIEAVLCTLARQTHDRRLSRAFNRVSAIRKVAQRRLEQTT